MSAVSSHATNANRTGGSNMHTNESSTVSDHAAARAVTAWHVTSVRDARRRRMLELAVEQGEAQGALVYAQIAKSRTLAVVMFLAAGAA